jgi:POT family proton-dependent oligopeptide transporter
VFSTFLMLVYFLPIVGGAVADRLGFGKCVTAGIIVMFLGYLLMAIPAARAPQPWPSWCAPC